MPRLIDAEDIKDYWVESEGSKEEFIKENMPDDADYYDYSDFFDKTLQAFKNVVNTSPTIDAEPVVHAHWDLVDSDLGYRQLQCSECSYERCVIDSMKNPIRCEDCGAKMDEDKCET